MTDALKAMVEAMFAEFSRQAHPHSGGVVARFINAKDNPSEVEGHIKGDFDLEKVARAGLAAIRDATPEMVRAFDAVDQAQYAAPDDSNQKAVIAAVIDEILKETTPAPKVQVYLNADGATMLLTPYGEYVLIPPKETP